MNALSVATFYLMFSYLYCTKKLIIFKGDWMTKLTFFKVLNGAIFYK